MKKLTIEQAAKLLKNGEVVAFPTETVYGLGANAWNTSAIQKVFTVKGRPSDNPLIVHIASRKMLSDFAYDVSDDAKKLMDAFWPGPLTLIFKKKPEVLDLITGGLSTVALRWPNHPIAQQLIAQSGPLVAPSANSSGKPSPTKPEHVKEDFGPGFPVLEAGRTNIGLESTVLDISKEPFKIYRPGYIGKRDIENITGVQVQLTSSKDNDTAVCSPGTKYTHYAPQANVRWLDENNISPDKNSLYLLHGLSPGITDSPKLNIICYRGNYSKMARELYDRFREADHKGLKRIFIQPFDKTDSSLPAITDALVNRITKAIG